MKKPPHPLRSYRFKKNLSMAELASDLSVCTAYIHNLEHNKSHRPVRRILKYCRDQQVSPEIFFPPDD